MSDTISRRRVAPIVVLVVAAVLGGLFWVLAGSKPENDTSGVINSHLLGKPASDGIRSRLLRIPPMDMSSTGIRQRIADGKSVRCWVPDPVAVLDTDPASMSTCVTV